MKVAPSILAADFLNLESEIKKLNMSTCDYIHLDVMDGEFVEDITFGTPIIQEIAKISSKKLDVHLMVKNPQNIIDKLMTIGVDIITIHVEVIENIDFLNTLKLCQQNKIILGIAFNPKTEIAPYEEYIKVVDYVLLMSVEPGRGGQKFNGEVLKKESQIRKINPNILINIDGGINKETVLEVKKTKIDIVVSGSFIFKGNISENIKLLKE